MKELFGALAEIFKFIRAEKDPDKDAKRIKLKRVKELQDVITRVLKVRVDMLEYDLLTDEDKEKKKLGKSIKRQWRYIDKRLGI